MEIHGYTESGSIEATIEGVRMTVPDDMGNRHRQMIAEWEAEGNTIPAYEPLPPPPLPPLSPRQLRLMLLQIDLTEQDIEAQIALIADPAERAAAEIEWNWATQYLRNHWLVEQLADALEFEPAQLDALWAYASEL